MTNSVGSKRIAPASPSPNDIGSVRNVRYQLENLSVKTYYWGLGFAKEHFPKVDMPFWRDNAGEAMSNESDIDDYKSTTDSNQRVTDKDRVDEARAASSS